MKRIAILLSSFLATLACFGFAGCSGCAESMPWYKQPASDVTIMLDANGGTGVTQTVYEGKSGEMVTLPTPTKEGCEFIGWYFKRTGSKFDSTTFPSGSPELVAYYQTIEDMPVDIHFSSSKEFSNKGEMWGYAIKFTTESLSVEDYRNYMALIANESIAVTMEAKWDAKIVPSTVLAEASPATEYSICYYLNSLYHNLGEATIENTFNEFIPVTVSCETTAKRVKNTSQIFILRAQNGLSGVNQGGTTYTFKNVAVKMSFTLPAGTIFK